MIKLLLLLPLFHFYGGARAQSPYVLQPRSPTQKGETSSNAFVEGPGHADKADASEEELSSLDKAPPDWRPPQEIHPGMSPSNPTPNIRELLQQGKIEDIPLQFSWKFKY